MLWLQLDLWGHGVRIHSYSTSTRHEERGQESTTVKKISQKEVGQVKAIFHVALCYAPVEGDDHASESEGKNTDDEKGDPDDQ